MTKSEAQKLIFLAFSEVYNPNDFDLNYSTYFNFTEVFIDGTNVEFDIDYIEDDYIVVRKNIWGKDETCLPIITDYEQRSIYL